MAKPVATADFATIYTNDTDGKIYGNILANDSEGAIVRFLDGVRIDDTHRKGTNTVQGEYGTFTIYSDGSYVYTLDKTDAAVAALASGQQLVERVSYKISDGTGATDFDYLTITINGENAKPVAVKDYFTLDVSAANVVEGNVLDNDTNAEGHEVLTVASAGKGSDLLRMGSGDSVSYDGLYGSLEVFKDGHTIYTLDEGVTVAAGSKLTDVFNYKIYDGSQTSNSTDYDTIEISIVNHDASVA